MNRLLHKGLNVVLCGAGACSLIYGVCHSFARHRARLEKKFDVRLPASARIVQAEYMSYSNPSRAVVALSARDTSAFITSLKPVPPENRWHGVPHPENGKLRQYGYTGTLYFCDPHGALTQGVHVSRPRNGIVTVELFRSVDD